MEDLGVLAITEDLGGQALTEDLEVLAFPEVQGHQDQETEAQA